MTTLLITRPLPAPVAEELRRMFHVTQRDAAAPLTSAEAAEALGAHDAILATVGDAFTADAFAAHPMPRTRLIANFGAGTDHIDLKAARSAGVAVTNTPGVVTEATADVAMMLTLMACRRAGEGERLVRRGEWTGWEPTQLLGLDLGGRTMGIVGMGRIGKAVARRAHAGFGMDIAFFNRSTVDDAGVPARQVAKLTDLARESDVLVVAVPGGPATRHLIDEDVLAAMRPHARLVNVARGDVVDQEALTKALAKGAIGGAGLDVYETEPDVPAALRAFENVVLLPHLGTATETTRVAMGRMAAANLVAWLEGRDLPNAV